MANSSPWGSKAFRITLLALLLCTLAAGTEVRASRRRRRRGSKTSVTKKLGKKLDKLEEDLDSLQEEVMVLRAEAIASSMPVSPTRRRRAAPTPAPPPVVVGQPYVCSTPDGTFFSRMCWCNGDVYYGKRYVSGKPGSGKELSFKEMTKGGCKNWNDNKHQKDGCKFRKHAALKNSPRARPGWTWIKCGGCMSWHDRGFWTGYKTQCYCMPKQAPPTPPPPTPAPPPVTFAPRPPPNERPPAWG